MKHIFFRILWKSRRDYRRVIISGIFIISLVFFSTALGSCLIYIEDGKTAEMTDLIFESEKAFLVSYLLLLFLMVLILLSYIRKRAYDYAMLDVLGIKKKHRYLFVCFEYLGIISGSLAGGLVLGVAEAEAMRRILQYIFSDITENVIYGWAPLKLTLIVGGIMFGLGFMACDELISCMGMEYVTSMGKKGGRSMKRAPVAAGAGFLLLALTFLSIGSYWGKIGSVVPYALAVAGLILMMTALVREYLHRLRKQERKYYRKIVWLDDWYHKFYYHMNITYVTAAFLMVILLGFGVSLMDALPVVQPEKYPYDLVWYADQADNDFLDTLREKYGAVIQTKPCIRVCTADFGEHTGISLSTYEEWTKEKRNLSGKEIHVVYQRDRGERGMIGIDYGKRMPRLYPGSGGADLWIPIRGGYLPSNLFLIDYTVVSEEDRILTGDFHSRALPDMKGEVFEHVIVFSDEEFDRIKKTARGSDLAVMIDFPEYEKEAVEEIKDYAAQYSQVNFYDWEKKNLIYEKEQMLIEDRQNKMFVVVSMLINIVTMFSSVLFILLEKAQNDYQEMEWKYRFYCQSGMTREKRKKNWKREAMMPERLAVLSGLLVSGLLISAQVFFKHLPVKWDFIYALETVLLMLAAWGILSATVRINTWRGFKKSERGTGREEE